MVRSIKIILVLFVLSTFSCKQGTKEIIKESSEYIGKQTTKKMILEGEELVGKELLKKSIKATVPIPLGKKSISVVEVSPGKWLPDVNNLGEMASKYPKEFNTRILLERRKAISPYMQFPTADNIKNINTSNLHLGEEASGTILEKNMLSSMNDEVRKIVNAFGGKAAHHVVEGTDPLAKKSREILKQFEIDINHPVNGIFLPTDKNSIFKGTLHKTSHSKAYSEYVFNQLKDCKNKDEAITVLNKIKYDLYEGKITLEGILHSVNKNDINI